LAGPWVWIKGWCFESHGRQLLGVRARIGERVVPGVYGWERLDVRAIFNGPPSSDHCGYGIAVELSPGSNQVALEVQVEGAGWQEFDRRDFVVPWPAAARAVMREWRFDLCRALGVGDPYRKLSDSDLEFHFGKLEQNGGHPLRLSAHHAPRPVILESLPTGPADPGSLPRMTVVTPSYQQRQFLEATIRSVLSQSGVRLDYIVEDGGSTDGTPALLERYSSQLKRWRSAPDAGQADALRRGFADLDCGPDDIMGYLNSDDLLMPGAARFVAEYFASHPEVDVVFGHRVLIDEAGDEVGRWFTPRTAVDDLHWVDLVPQETLFWRKRVWDRVGGIDPKFQFALDWDLLLRFQTAGAQFVRLPWFLGLFRLHPTQKSQARLLEVGIPEMDALRARSLYRTPEPAELRWRTLRAQLDSCQARDRLKHGQRW
jgi:hypothetical protein